MLRNSHPSAIGARPQRPCGTPAGSRADLVRAENPRAQRVVRADGGAFRRGEDAWKTALREESKLPLATQGTRPAGPGSGASQPTAHTHRLTSESSDRDQMLDRLRHLRRVLPVLAQEMASARRQAAKLRTDNRRLAEQVRELRQALDAHEHRSEPSR